MVSEAHTVWSVKHTLYEHVTFHEALLGKQRLEEHEAAHLRCAVFGQAVNRRMVRAGGISIICPPSTSRLMGQTVALPGTSVSCSIASVGSPSGVTLSLPSRMASRGWSIGNPASNVSDMLTSWTHPIAAQLIHFILGMYTARWAVPIKCTVCMLCIQARQHLLCWALQQNLTAR